MASSGLIIFEAYIGILMDPVILGRGMRKTAHAVIWLVCRVQTKKVHRLYALKTNIYGLALSTV